MKKILISGFVVFTFGFYVFFTKHEEQESAAAVAVIKKSTAQNVAENTTNSVEATPSSEPTTAVSGKYKDGEYTGNRVDAFYGYVQVKAIITNGKIADIVFLEYPNDRDTSVEINTQAILFLKQEAISVQTSEVEIVTGATDTSVAFRESLKNALDQAQI